MKKKPCKKLKMKSYFKMENYTCSTKQAHWTQQLVEWEKRSQNTRWVLGQPINDPEG